MAEYRFSVVIPTYNVECYIERCINSLQRQTLQNFEMVFVDDCGDDASIKIVEAFAKRDERIKVIYHPENLGTYWARKTGIENAKGEYVVFLDPDDELMPETIELLTQSLFNNPDLLLFGSKIMPPLKFWQSKASVPNINTTNNKDQIVQKIIKCKNLNRGVAGKAAKRDVLLRAYSFLNININQRLVFGEDQLFLLALIYKIESALSIKDRLYIYHKNPTSITMSDNLMTINKNIDQLQQVMNLMINISGVDPVNRVINKQFIDDLTVFQLRLKSKTDSGYLNILINYIKILEINKSFKDLIKFLICFVSAGKLTL